MLAGWWLVEHLTPVRLALSAIALSTLLLLHPFHAPALVIAITLYAAARLQWRTGEGDPPLWARWSKQIMWLALWLLLSVGLIAWWVVPLITHYTPYAAALVRATTDQVISWFDAGRIEWLWLAGLMALMLLAQRHPRVEATVGVLALLAPLLVGGILFNDQILLARFGITILDPIRFIAEYYLALILLVGCAVGAVTSRFLWRTKWLAALCSVILVVTLRPYLILAWDDLQTRIPVPAMYTLKGIMAHPAFEGYWDALRNDPTGGRIFFVSNYLFLPDEDGEVIPTTVNSMTPYLTGREIIGGTFSHWSPIARWLWVGDPRAELLPAQVELDDQQLFGLPWEQISADLLATNLALLNVTTIVVEREDQTAIALLDSSPHFSLYWQNSAFSIYHLASNSGAWVEAEGASAQLIERTARRWRIEIAQSAPNATILLKMSHYPLWRASANGSELPLQPTAEGLQRFTLPEGGPYTLEVIYREGLAEWSGLAITIVTLLITLYLLAYPSLLARVLRLPRRLVGNP
jgi:hypothetical protein